MGSNSITADKSNVSDLILNQNDEVISRDVAESDPANEEQHLLNLHDVSIATGLSPTKI